MSVLAPSAAPDGLDLGPGYHLTDIGVLPADWEVVPLGDLFELKNGVNADKEAYGRGVRFINVLEVITRSHIREHGVPGRVDLPKPLLEAFEVRSGDLVFNRTSETLEEVGLAATYIGDEKVVFGGFVIRGRARRPSLHASYWGYALRAHLVRVQVVAKGQGAIRANIGQADLRKVMLPVPSKEEQAAIASVLRDVDSYLDSLALLLDKKRGVRNAVLHRLLSGKTRLAGFLEPWRGTAVGKLGTFIKGRGIRRDDVQSEGIPCIRYGELYTRYVGYVDRPVSCVDEAVAASALPIYRGDLLFAASGETAEEIGMCLAYVGHQRAVAGGDIVVLRGHGCDPVFLSALMNSPAVAKQKSRYGQGDAVVHISARALANISIDLPAPAEQEAIAQVICDLDSEIAVLRARQEKVMGVRQAMLQELLPGKIRLVNAEDVG